jgi:hypothetical protein
VNSKAAPHPVVSPLHVAAWEVHAMSQNDPGPAPTKRIPRWAKYAFWGGAAGFAVGVGILFVMAVFYGEAIGLSSAACATFACVLTLLLSQPAGAGGMVVGAVVAALVGAVVYCIRHFSRPM